MKRSIRLLILPAILLGALPASAEEKPNFDAYFDAATAPARSARPAPASPDGVASAFDAKRGVPTFLWAGKQQPAPPLGFAGSAQGAATFYVGAYAHRWNLPATITDGLEIAHVHDTGRGGIIVTFRQRSAGIEVFRGEVKVLLARNLELIAISGSPSPSAKGKGAFKLGPTDAIVVGFNDLFGTSAKSGDLVALKKTVADYRYYDLGTTPGAKATGVRLTEPFRLKKVFFPMPTGMVPAYWFEILGTQAGNAGDAVFTYVIAADDGRLLLRSNLTESDSNSYRVWADAADGRPLDGPTADFSPSPTGLPDGAAPAFIAPILKSFDGFNTNPFGNPDSWLPSGAKQTLGNNVDAYTDDGPGPTLANGQLPPNAPPDGFSNGDLRATTTAANVFDRVYDVSASPLASTSQSMAATTQLFYNTNWLHDWFYDSGFDEAAGNAQQNNFGRGGLGGDVLHAESQDGAVAGSRSNANMSTPADGTSPRMQMYLWTGINTSKLTDTVTNADIPTNTASFGATNFSLTGSLALAADGVAPVNNGCEAIVNNISGQIALIDRGLCPFAAKAANAQAAGAIGVIIANNAPNVAPPGLGGGDPTVTIPVLSVTFEQGVAFKTALQAGAVTVKMDRVSGVERDGSIDNTVVAHEWGHYIHHRLVSCGLIQCRGQSEGWGDFDAIQMVLRPGDNLDGTFALAQYAAATFGPNYAYFGIRRAPYSTDMTKNGFTFKHISDGVALPATPLASGGATNSEVHNTGEIWAQMMFEGYVSMLKTTLGPAPTRTFQQVRRTMSDYVVAGMKITPIEPDFTEQRDAILAAAYASDPGDMALFADAFAKRGLGTCAVSPPKDTTDNTGAIESFAVQGNFAVLSLDVDDSVSSCDKDGVLDGEESGKVTVKVMNTGVTTLSGTTVSVSSTLAGVTFPNGAMITLPKIEPFATATATIDIDLAASVTGIQQMDLKADVTNAAGCTPTVSVENQFAVNYDNLTSAANIDDVESDLTAWTVKGANSDQVWAREKGTTGNHSWHGIDFSSLSDTSLESPTLNVSATAALVVSFSHAYSFEADATTNWDGGVLEISTNNGQSWADISTFAAPGYGGVIGNAASNPLMNRQAFVGQNAAYPGSDSLSLNLGTQLAGKQIKLRFRIGTDLGSGDFGWDIDDVVIEGITNTPFTAIVGDTTNCEHAPKANAGPDQMVPTATGVILDGSASSDVDGDPLTFLWKQTAGPLVPIINPQGQKTTFLAPAVLVDTKLTFELAVSDATQTTKDSVDIVVNPIPVVMATTTTSGAGGAGGAGAGGAGGATTGTGTGGMASSTTAASTTSGAMTTTSGEGGSGGSVDVPLTRDGCACSTSDTGDGPSNGAVGVGLLGAALFFARRRRAAR